MMKVAWMFSAGAALLLGCTDSSQSVIRVSPNGDDAGCGSVAKPLRTLVGARNRIREIKARNGGRLPGSIEVVFADGEYELTEAVEFLSEDSGLPGSPVVYRAEHLGKAVFSGGRKLDLRPLSANDPWLKLMPEKARSQVRVADLPKDLVLPGFGGGRVFGNEYPVLLYAETGLLPIASWPDNVTDWKRLGEEWTFATLTDELIARNAKDPKRIGFVSRSRNLMNWAREPDGWVHGMWKYEWDDAISPMLAADPKTGEVSIDKSRISRYLPGKTASYRVLNMFSELDRPGEWAVDRKRGRVYVWPATSSQTVVAAWTKSLVSASGLENVVFEGLRFRHARGEALEFVNCRGIRVRMSTISDSASWGLVFAGGFDNRAEGNDLFRLGEGGIVLSGGDAKTLSPADTVAVNNHIGHFGQRLWSYRPGISLGSKLDDGECVVVGCRVEHNLIHHSRHMGIGLVGNDNYIGYNIVHDTCAWTEDAGALYGYTESSWADGRGIVIERNAVYETGKHPKHTHTYGIYLDGFLSGVTVRSNLVISTACAMHQNGGQANVWQGNILAGCGAAFINCNYGSQGDGSAEKSAMWRSLKANRALYHSEPWISKYPLLARQSDMTDADFANNSLFVQVGDNVISSCGGDWFSRYDKMEGYYTITNNVRFRNDPGFIAFTNLNWELDPASAAYRMLGPTGFAEMGLLADAPRATPAVKFGDGVTPPKELKTPYKTATVRVDVLFGSKSFTVDSPMAKDFVNCIYAPSWCKARNRIVADFGVVDQNGQWADYSFSFTPLVSGRYTIHLMGEHGLKTAMDDMRMTGGSLHNGGFEENGHWSKPEIAPNANLQSEVDEPYGLVASTPKNVAPEGNRMAVVNHDIIMIQTVDLVKDVPVTISFKAAAWK